MQTLMLLIPFLYKTALFYTILFDPFLNVFLTKMERMFSHVARMPMSILVLYLLNHCSLISLVLWFPPCSTIQGRIDQVNQLLELDYQKRGGARYTALDKWTKQLNSLNQAIVSKLT